MIKNRRKRPIAIDLFAGAGGLSLGFEQAGFDVVAAVEIDPIHCSVHHYNFPKTKVICKSVIDLTGDQLRAEAALLDTEVDVICGGAPCQGFSTIGKRALNDERNMLVYHFCRLVSEVQPKYAVFENVRGLTLGNHKRFLQEIIDALTDSGYRVVLPYKVLNASDYGVPQERRRLFLLAARADQPLPTYPLVSTRTTVGEAILDLPNADSYDALLDRDWQKAKCHGGSLYARRLRGDVIDPADFSYPRVWDKSIITSSLRTAHTEESIFRFQTTRHGTMEPISRFLKLHPAGFCNTLRAGTDSARGAFTSPRPIHPVHPRVITVREAARLHSYPDWFRFHVTKWHGFRQVGNSVPPLLARAVASSIIRALDVIPTTPKQFMHLGDEKLLQHDMGQAANYFCVSRTVIAQRIRKEPSKRLTVKRNRSLFSEAAFEHA